MKRQHVVLAITAFNFGILGLAALAIGANAQAPALKQPTYRAARVNWSSSSTDAPLPPWGEAVLSPTKRPVAETTTTTTTTVEREPTDDELRAELELKLNREVRLLRILYAEGDPESCFAKIRLGSREIALAPNSAFYDSVAPSLVKTVPAWLADVQVKGISADGVTINAPSRKPEKRFEFKLTIKETGLITVGPHNDVEPRRGYAPMPGAEKRQDEPRKEDQSVQNTRTSKDADGGYKLGTEDLADKAALEAAAGCLRVLVDEMGEPIGLQIPDDVKEDNLLVRCGGKRGDIIKSVNGKPVKTLADAKHSVREEYDAGKREFEIGFERDGEPGRQIIRVPK